MLYFILYSTTLYTSLCRAQEVGTLASQEVAFSWSSFAWHLPRHHQGMSTIAWLKSAQSPGSWRMQRFAMVPHGSPWFAVRSEMRSKERLTPPLKGPVNSNCAWDCTYNGDIVRAHESVIIHDEGGVSSCGVALAEEAARVRSQSCLMVSFYDLDDAGQEREDKDCVSEARQSLLSCLVDVLLSPIWVFVKQCSKFVTIQHSPRGKEFCILK